MVLDDELVLAASAMVSNIMHQAAESYRPIHFF